MKRIRTAVAVFTVLASALPAVAQDPDAPPKLKFTREDVMRWMPVDPAALASPSAEMRELAAEVAKGTTDTRLLRAYWRNYIRMYPFTEMLPADVRRRAKEVKDALELTRRAPPTTGCWSPLGPRNIPGRMTAIAVHPTDSATIYAAGADGGVWKTTDLGANWAPLGDFESTLAVGAMVLDPTTPDTIYVGTGEGNYAVDNLAGQGVLKSIDGGATWTGSTGFASHFHEMAIDTTNPSRLFAATRNGLFVTTDAGANWNAVAALPSEDTTSVVISAGDPNVVLVGVGRGFGSSANTGLYRSTDGGASFSLAPTFPSGGTNGILKIAQCRDVPNRVYAAVHQTSNADLRGVYRSDDEGVTWTQVAMPPANTCGYPTPPPGTYFCWYCLTLAADPVDPDLAYIGGVPIHRTTDGGQTWTQIINTSAVDAVHVDQHHFVCPAGDTIWSANDGGVDISTDRGDSWSDTGLTLETAQYYHFTTDPTDDTYAIGGTQDNGTQLFSFSTLWSRILGGDGAFTAIDWQNPNIYYGSYQNLNMQRSTDRGASWVDIGGGIAGSDRRAFIAPFILDRSNPRTMYAGTHRLWRSTNQGDNFTAISTSLTTGTITAIDNCRDVPATLWVGSSSGTLWRSPDTGGSWQDRSAGLPNRAITSISAHPIDPNTAYVSVGGTGSGHIWRTSDGGATWVDTSATLPDIHFNRVLMIEDQPTSIVAGADLGIYRSDDDGASWYVYGSELPNVAVDWISYSPLTQTIRAATHGRGAWQLAPVNTCVLLPGFAGVTAITIDAAQCQPLLEWEPGTSACPGAPGLSYNVYRSIDPTFSPTPSDLVQAGVMGTSFVDVSAPTDTPLYYIVRVESGETGFGGPANGGREDSNTAELWIETGNPIVATMLNDDGGDSSAWLAASPSWSVNPGVNTTPAGNYAYRSTGFGQLTHGPDICAAVVTPEVVPQAGATLTYQASYNLEEDWDGVVVEITTDGGATWVDLPPNGGYPGSFAATGNPPLNACAYPASQRAFSGPPGNAARTPFAPFTSSLAAYVGQSIRIRWRLASDPGLQLEGFYLDDIAIGPVASGAAPDMGNVLLGFDESAAVRFTWADAAVSTYRLYESPDSQMAGRTLVGSATSGTPGILDGAPRTLPVHYYRLHAVVGCNSEGP